MSRGVVSSESADLPEAKKAAANHATDFEPPLYNVWKQQEKTPGGYAGPSPATKPFTR